MSNPITNPPVSPLSPLNSCTTLMIFRVIACPPQGPWLLTDENNDHPRSVFVEHPQPGIRPGDLIRGDWTLDQYVSAHGTLWAMSTLRHMTQWTPPALPSSLHALLTPEVSHG